MPSSVRCSGVLIEIFFRDARERFRAFEEDARRPCDEHGEANDRNQRQQPASRGAIQQHVGNEVHQDDDFEREENAELDERFPCAGNEINDAARGFENEKREPEVAEDAERAAAAAAIDFELGLDFVFKDFEVRVNAASSHAAEFAVDQREIRKNGQPEREQDGADGVGPEKEFHGHERPNFRRRRFSTRVIWPLSVSWS